MASLLDLVHMLFGGFDVPDIELRAIAWLKEKSSQYPDVQERTDALAAWLSTTISEASPNLDPAAMANKIKGIATDMIAGQAGVDPDAGGGMG